MPRPARRTAQRIALALLLGLPCLQHASAKEDEPAEAPAKIGPLGARPVQLGVLSALRGGTEVFNDMKLKGVVANNQAVDAATGSNLITEGAFAGATGLPMVVQNTGNNVLIQNATIVNVQVK